MLTSFIEVNVDVFVTVVLFLDEGALVRAAGQFGFKFNERTPDYVEINVVSLLL